MLLAQFLTTSSRKILIMKKILLLICALPFVAFAQKQIPVGSTVQSVTVYLQGAEVNRKSSPINLPLGQSEIVFTDLSSTLNQSSIQVSGTGDVIVLGAVFQVNYLGSRKDQSEVKNVKDSIEIMNTVVSGFDNQLAVLAGQEDILNKNQVVGGANNGVTLAALQAVYEFYVSKMTQIKADELAINQKKTKANETLAKLNQQLSEWNATGNTPTGEVVVQVQAKSATTANLKLSYVINNAGWTPVYDLRSTDINSAMTINYKANVWQSAEADWKNVKMTLSTGNPTVSATSPTLNPWYLYFYQPTYYESYNYGYNAPSAMNQSYDKNYDGVNEKAEQNIQSSAQFTTVNQTQMTTEFDINLDYTIPADGKTHLVAIQDYT